MRILVLTSTFPRWKGDRDPPFVFELCRRLAEAHEVLVIAPHCRGTPAREQLGRNLRVLRFRYAPEALESLAYDGGILEKLRLGKWRYALLPLFLLAELLAALAAVRRQRPDVIHAHWVLPQGIVGLAARFVAGGRRPGLVCTAHGTDLLGLRGGLASRVKRLVLQRATAVTVVSAAMKTEALQLGAAASRIHVMPMGVDAQRRFSPGDGAERSAGEVLFVGRLVPKKGVAELLQAFTSVRASVPGARLTIVGAGPLGAEAQSRATSLGIEPYVTFAGAIPNDRLREHYRRAALLVFPSAQEGFGLVVTEALACECPVVASDLPAIRDVIQDGVTGLLARQGDPQDLAEKIVRVLGDPGYGRAMALRGRRMVLERFDWSSVARGYEELLGAASRGAR